MPTEQRHELGRRQRGDEEPDRGRRVDRARMQRREPQPDLEVHGEQEQEAGVGGDEQDPDRHAAGEPPVAKQAKPKQRRAAPVLEPPLIGDERRERRGRADQAHDHPRGPALIATLDQWHREQQQRGRDQADTAPVKPGPGVRLIVGQHHHRRQDRQHPDGQVDEEHGPPGPAEDVQAKQRAADQLPRDRCHARR